MDSATYVSENDVFFGIGYLVGGFNNLEQY